MTEKKCVVCGEVFLANRRDHRYCSVNCRAKAQRHRIVVENSFHLCQKCGKLKEEERAFGKYKLCGKCEEAEDEKKVQAKTKTCEHCGKAYVSTRCTQKYCSDKCRSTANNRIISLQRTTWQPSTQACEWCGEPFVAIRYNQKCCTRECAYELYKARVYKTEKTCICGYCEKEFKTMRKRTYCSSECRIAANGQKQRVADRKLKAKRDKSKPKFTLAQVNAMARAEGLTYGQYMAKYSL